MSERINEKAEENEAMIADATVRSIRSKVPVPGTPVPGTPVPEECDCGEPIPDGRRALGYPTCTFCASKPNGR